MAEDDSTDPPRLVRGVMTPYPDEMEEVKEQGYALAVEMPHINRMELVSEKHLTKEGLESLWDMKFADLILISWDPEELDGTR